MRGQNSVIVMSKSDWIPIGLGETLRTLLYPFKYLDSYITSLPLDLMDFVQNPLISFIGIPYCTKDIEEEVESCIDWSLILLVFPEEPDSNL